MANEKRLIDANALKREIRKMPWAVRKAETNGKEEIVAIINDAPTVDAEEVVHGRWNESDWSGIKVGGFMACSNCNVMIPTPYGKRYCLHRLHYCPNCGAKMDGGNEDG